MKELSIQQVNSSITTKNQIFSMTVSVDGELFEVPIDANAYEFLYGIFGSLIEKELEPVQNSKVEAAEESDFGGLFPPKFLSQPEPVSIPTAPQQVEQVQVNRPVSFEDVGFDLDYSAAYDESVDDGEVSTDLGYLESDSTDSI